QTIGICRASIVTHNAEDRRVLNTTHRAKQQPPTLVTLPLLPNTQSNGSAASLSRVQHASVLRVMGDDGCAAYPYGLGVRPWLGCSSHHTPKIAIGHPQRLRGNRENS
ncbi:MAG: hypothetical protein AAFW75_29085, partial [Cyanobacteria bacterium J06636_16]